MKPAAVKRVAKPKKPATKSKKPTSKTTNNKPPLTLQLAPTNGHTTPPLASPDLYCNEDLTSMSPPPHKAMKHESRKVVSAEEHLRSIALSYEKNRSESIEAAAMLLDFSMQAVDTLLPLPTQQQQPHNYSAAAAAAAQLHQQQTSPTKGL